MPGRGHIIRKQALQVESFANAFHNKMWDNLSMTIKGMCQVIAHDLQTGEPLDWLPHEEPVYGLSVHPSQVKAPKYRWRKNRRRNSIICSRTRCWRRVVMAAYYATTWEGGPARRVCLQVFLNKFTIVWLRGWYSNSSLVTFLRVFLNKFIIAWLRGWYSTLVTFCGSTAWTNLQLSGWEFGFQNSPHTAYRLQPCFSCGPLQPCPT